MAHKLLTEIIERKHGKETKNFDLGQFQGKFGISIFLWMKEIFVGISISEVEIERVVKKKMVKNVKGKVRVLQFD